jgi:SEC-C motif/Tetratricopeptide repeat
MNSDAAPVSPDAKTLSAPSRNAQCPCGSGKRYKDCHGALGEMSLAPDLLDYPQWCEFSVEEKRKLSSLMSAALSEQKRGEFASAERLYREVLDKAPDTYDALHMLGTVRYMLADYDDAEAFIQKAIEIAGPLKDFLHNLTLCRDRRAASNQSHRAVFEAATDLLQQISRSTSAGRRNVAWNDFFTASAGARLEIVYQANVTSSGAWLLVAELVRSMRPEVVVKLTPVNDVGIPTIRSLDHSDASELATRPLIRLFVGMQSDYDFDVGNSVRAVQNLVLMDRDDPEPILNLIHRLRSSEQWWQLYATSPFLSDKYLCSQLHFKSGSANFAQARVRQDVRRQRIGVFVPDADPLTSTDRWRLIERLRERYDAIDLLYFRSLPAEHLPTAQEHLVSLFDPRLPTIARHWRLLIYWSGPKQWMQYHCLLNIFAPPGLLVHATTGAVHATHHQVVRYFTNVTDALDKMAEIDQQDGNLR